MTIGAELRLRLGKSRDNAVMERFSPADAAPILLAGPTASGKSALALALAEAVDGVVVNADALQVYDGWRVLTARPPEADLARAPHALYGHVAPETPDYSVGRWLVELEDVLKTMRAAGRRAIMTGGTGLYFTAATQGLAPIPPIPEAVRVEAMARETAAMLAELDARDPETAASIDRANPRRVQRAWEVLTATGEGLAAWRARTSAPLIPIASAVRLVIAPDRAALHEAIARRFRAMAAGGALEEARVMAGRGLSPSLPAMQALGAQPLSAHLAGETDLETAIETSIAATRQYAKRQETWFRNRFGDWPRLDPARLRAALADPFALLETEC